MVVELPPRTRIGSGDQDILRTARRGVLEYLL
jgi:hypothetical protein